MSRTLINVSGTMLLAGLVYVAAGSAQAFYHGPESGNFTGPPMVTLLNVNVGELNLGDNVIVDV